MSFKKLLAILFLFLAFSANAQNGYNVSSPNKAIQLTVNHLGDGSLQYSLTYKGKAVILPSSLGMQLSSPNVNLTRFTVTDTASGYTDETWQPVLGEYSAIRNQYNELAFGLADKSGSNIKLRIVFKVYNEGVGFRYEFPQQEALNHFIVAEEKTAFHLTGDHKTFWIPGDYDTNEFMYNETKLSQVDASNSRFAQDIFAKTFYHKDAVQTPLMMKTAEGLYINLHEAALINYPVMQLMVDKASFTLNAHLVPDAVGNKAYLQAPAKTPWRTIIVSDKATEVVAANRMILNLNEPTKLQNTSWIKPQKFMGVWWENIIGKSSWDMASGRHSATTANVKKYIDFAAKNGISGLLVEGWNEGWEDWFGKWKENVFDFVTPYSDFDIKEITRYAKEKGVNLILHHETSGSVTNYERRLDTAFRYLLNNGVNAVKTGYVGKIIPRGEHHDGQWMVNHYIRVAEKAGQYGVMIDVHEPARPTGLSRTYPNWLASEAARGMEFRNLPPAHETILPFTRLMGGPMDYTPGIFQTKMNYYFPDRQNDQVNSTIAKQLALYVIMYSPIQMAADMPENYEKHMDAFQFIKDVAVDWDDTKVLLAEPGDYLVSARKAKGTNNWFLGAVTDEEARNLTASLSFLDKGQKYVATIYRDAADAHWDKNPQAYVIEKFVVDNNTKLNLKLAAGGGTAVSLVPVTGNEAKGLKKYK